MLVMLYRSRLHFCTLLCAIRSPLCVTPRTYLPTSSPLPYLLSPFLYYIPRPLAAISCSPLFIPVPYPPPFTYPSSAVTYPLPRFPPLPSISRPLSLIPCPLSPAPTSYHIPAVFSILCLIFSILLLSPFPWLSSRNIFPTSSLVFPVPYLKFVIAPPYWFSPSCSIP